MLINDIFSQRGMRGHTFFVYLQITKSDTRRHLKSAPSLVIEDGHFIYLRVVCGNVWANMIPLSHSTGDQKKDPPGFLFHVTIHTGKWY